MYISRPLEEKQLTLSYKASRIGIVVFKFTGSPNVKSAFTAANKTDWAAIPDIGGRRVQQFIWV